MTADSEPGHGTTFQILLQAEDASRRIGSEETGKPALRRGVETILLVEDDPGLRRLTRIILERQGYRF